MTITVDEQTITLPAKVFDFLKLLILHTGATVTKEQAIEEIWLGNVEVGKRGAGNAIWHLRKSFTELGLDPEDILKTVTKMGYQLIAAPVAINELPRAFEKVNSSNKSKYTLYLSFAFIALIFVFLFSILNRDHTDKLSSSIITPVTEASKITNFEGVEEQAAISPDGQYMAFQWRRNEKKSQIFIKEIGSKDLALRQVSLTNDNDVSPTWSPDSQSLAYFRVNKLGECSLHLRELISNKDLLLANDCISSGFLQGLDWSPDGKKIAYSQKMSDRVAVAIYNIEDQTISPYSYPESGEKDLIMKWSKNSKTLLFVRSTDLDASIYLVDESKVQKTLVAGENMVISLAWDHSNNTFYYNSMKNGAFVVNRYDMKNKSISEFYHDSAVGAIAVDEHTRSLFFSKHVAQEYIAVHSLNSGKLINQLASSSRDLYGQYVTNSGDMLFLSNRSGSWELWLKSGAVSKQLTNKQGLVTIPVVSPHENSFVIPIKRPNSNKFVMFQGTLPTGKQAQLFEIEGDVRNPSYSIDGKSLYFSSNVDEEWGIYKYSFVTQSIELIISDSGKFAIEAPDGGIYYSKENIDGIFYLSADKMQSHQVTKKLRTKDWGSFFYLNNALHYLNRTNELDILVRIDSGGKEHNVMSFPVFSIRNTRAFSTIKNNQIAVTMQGISDADIYSIPLSD
jgi:Tol biopolymer transport system component/DNA-binding winged helix-turn-helix (wHTH) protein